jgi:predicted esterase
MAASLAEGLAQGARGAAYDGMLLGRDWGFEPEQLHSAVVHLWHGEMDTQVPVEQARALSRQIRGICSTFYASDAHISTIVNHGGEIIGTLVKECAA